MSQIEPRNVVNDRLKADEMVYGLSVRLTRSGEIARIAKATGHDFLFIDNQHATFSPETIIGICQTAIGCGVAPLVRVKSTDDRNAALHLDCGAMGIIFPDVSTAEQAKQAVDYCKFAPIGRRSVYGGGYPIFDYAPISIPDTQTRLNATTTVMLIIETVEGVRNIEAIASLPGVDVIFVGANDLHADAGKPGGFGDPEVQEMIEHVIATARKHGKGVGFGGDRDMARTAHYVQQGVRLMMTQSDVGLMLTAGKQLNAKLREAVEA